MSSAIQNMLDKKLGEAARSSKFEAFVFFPNKINNVLSKTFDKEDFLATCKSSTFPSVTHTPIEFKFKGRRIPIKGQSKFNQTWDCTFYLTEDHALKKSLETWLLALDKPTFEKRNENKEMKDFQDFFTNNSYVVDMHIFQKNFDDTKATAKYTLHNAYPLEIAIVPVANDAVGTVLEFNCTFSYSHYDLSIFTGEQNNFIDSLLSTALNASSNAISGVVKNLGTELSKVLGLDSSGNANSLLNSLNKQGAALSSASSSKDSQTVGPGLNKMVQSLYDYMG